MKALSYKEKQEFYEKVCLMKPDLISCAESAFAYAERLCAERSLSAQDEVPAQEPIYYSITYKGMHCNNVVRDREYAESELARLNKQYPDGDRAIVPLYVTPSPSLAVRDMVKMEDPIMIPRGLVGAACYLIRKHAPDSKLLEKLRAFTIGNCSGEPANCPDNEGYGCACDPMNKAAMREQQK